MRIRRGTIAALLALSAAGCGGEAGRSTRLRVVAAFYPLQEIVSRLGAELVAVTNVTPPGAEPHDLELRPSDVRRLRGAGLVLYLGRGFQPALEDAIGSLPDRSRAVDLLAGLPLKRSSGDDEGLSADPHVWLSPPLMRRMSDAVAGVLAGSLPSHAAGIRSRASALADSLAALDREYRAKLARCARRELFTSHTAFSYLADEYGLTQIAITGLSPEAEPSPKRLQEVARLARAHGATTIFFETLVSPRVAQAVARIVGARTAVLDPIEGPTREQRAAGAGYLSIMRSNLTTLSEALGCAT